MNHLRAVSWIVAILAVSFLAVGASAAQVKEALAAVRAIVPEWAVVQADAEPSVTIGNVRGHRLILRQDVKEYTSIPQQQKAALAAGEPDWPHVIVHNHIELVLIPAASPVIDGAKVPWRDFQQQYHVQAVDMGTGMGFRWLGKMSLWDQDRIRETLKLEGGEDRLELAMAGLKIKDKGSCTANTAGHIIEKFGDRAVETLRKTALAATPAEDSQATICAALIGRFKTDRSTEVLQELYGSQEPFLAKAAAYGLIYSGQPRKPAKTAYIDMIRRGWYIDYAIQICVTAGWKEAVPAIREVYDNPQDLRTFRAAWAALRKFDRIDVPKDLEDARGVLTFTAHSDHKPTTRQVNDAKAVFLNARDREAAVMLAVDLALMVTKGDVRQTNAIGVELLSQLPPADVRPVLVRLQRMKDQSWREEIRRKLAGLAGVVG